MEADWIPFGNLRNVPTEAIESASVVLQLQVDCPNLVKVRKHRYSTERFDDALGVSPEMWKLLWDIGLGNFAARLVILRTRSF